MLLILAGVSIQLISGSNGILGRASQALDANDKAMATEKMELKITYLNMISYGENTRKATLQELADGLFADKEVEYVKLKNQEIASLEPIDVTGESSFFVKLKEYPYEFEIDSNFLVAINGEPIENPVPDGYMKTPTETLEVNENGDYDVLNYANVKVDVPLPTGTMNVTSNGSYNVKDFEQVNVNVTTDKEYTKAEYDARYNAGVSAGYSNGYAEGQKAATVATTKTLLWTNPSPTASMGSRTFSLSSSLENFTHILIRWKVSTSDSTIYDDLFKIDPIRVTSGVTVNRAYFGITGRLSTR